MSVVVEHPAVVARNGEIRRAARLMADAFREAERIGMDRVSLAKRILRIELARERTRSTDGSRSTNPKRT